MWQRLMTSKWGRVAVIGVVLTIIIEGIWLINKNKQVEEEIVPEIVLEESMMMTDQPQEAMTEEEKAQIEAVFSAQGAEMTLLSDVTGGGAVGTAWREFDDINFYHKVEATGLPALEKGFFYEGWLVGGEGFFSTGRMAVVEGAGSLYYKSDQDQSDFAGAVITLEPEDGDPAPDKHVLEGSF